MNPVNANGLLRTSECDELLKANPVESAVTAIANDFGFTHLGYFSRDYKAQFGELPSETLQALSRIAMLHSSCKVFFQDKS